MFAPDVSAGGDDGQRTGGADAQGIQGFADDVFAQHRADRGQSVAAAGERGTAGALQVHVAAEALRVFEFAVQQRPAVTEQLHIVAELVPCVDLRHRVGVVGLASSGSAVPVSRPIPAGLRS